MVNRIKEIEDGVRDIEQVFSKCFGKLESVGLSIIQLQLQHWYITDINKITLEGSIINSALFNNKKD